MAAQSGFVIIYEAFRMSQTVNKYSRREEIMVNTCHTGGDDSSNIVKEYHIFIGQLCIVSTSSTML